MISKITFLYSLLDSRTMDNGEFIRYAIGSERGELLAATLRFLRWVELWGVAGFVRNAVGVWNLNGLAKKRSHVERFKLFTGLSGYDF